MTRPTQRPAANSADEVAPHDGARGDRRKANADPRCGVCGNSVPVDASALAAAKADAWDEGAIKANQYRGGSVIWDLNPYRLDNTDGVA